MVSLPSPSVDSIKDSAGEGNLAVNLLAVDEIVTSGTRGGRCDSVGNATFIERRGRACQPLSAWEGTVSLWRGMGRESTREGAKEDKLTNPKAVLRRVVPPDLLDMVVLVLVTVAVPRTNREGDQREPVPNSRVALLM